MRLRQEKPSILNARVACLIHLLVDVVGFSGSKDVAFEGAVSTFPHGFCAVHSSRNFINRQSLPPFRSNSPGSFAEAPVIVVTIGSSCEGSRGALDSDGTIVVIPELAAGSISY